MTRARGPATGIARRARDFAAGLCIVFLAGLAGMTAGCGGHGTEGVSSPPGPAVAGVEVETAKAATRQTVVEAVGTVRAKTIAAVAPQVMGRITSVPVAEGARVRRGATLATIDDRAIRAKLAAAEAAIAEAEAGLGDVEGAVAQAQAQKELAEKTFGRFRQLHEAQAVTKQEFDEAFARRTVAVQAYDRALKKRAQVRAKLARAKAEADAAREMLSYTRVTAPFAGVVIEKKADDGSMAVPGNPIVMLEKTGQYRIEASVPAAYLHVLSVGSAVRVVLDPSSGREIAAQVSEVVPRVDPATRTFFVKVDLPGGLALRTGMFGRVRFPAGKAVKILVPERAVVRVGGYDGVYVVGADNVARLVIVSTGAVSEGQVEILAGINAGARVAVSEVDHLTDGARVEVR